MRTKHLALLLLVLAGCTPEYPMDKEGTWSIPPVSSNERNLRTMIVNPQDLIAGRGEANSLAQEGGRPVSDLFAGKRKSLPVESASTIYAIPSSGGGSGGQ